MGEYREVEVNLSTMGNLTAVLMYRDIPVMRFVYDNGYLQTLQVSNRGLEHVPDGIIDSNDKAKALIEFLLKRICPNVTLNGTEFKEDECVLFPHLQRYLIYTYGQSIFDEYWLDCVDSRDCWKDTIFEFTRFPRKTWKQLPRYRKSKEIERYVKTMVT